MPTPSSFDDFMKLVNPNMLDSSGRFKSAEQGGNYMDTGLTPQQVWDDAQDFKAKGGWSDDNRAGSQGGQEGADAHAAAMLDPNWQPGVTDSGGFLGNAWRTVRPVAAMAALAYGGGALMGGEAGAGAGVTAGGGSLGAGSDFGLGTYGTAGTGATGAIPGALGSGTFDLGASVPTLDAGGLAAPGAAGSALSGAAPAAGELGSGTFFPTAADIMDPGIANGVMSAPGATAGASTLGPGATGTFLGESGTGLTSAGGAASVAGDAGSGSSFMNTVKDVGSIPGVGSVIGGAVKNLVGGAINNALSPSTTGPNSAVNAADPFHDQRAQYQTQLQNLMNGQFSPTDPSYAFRFQQGQQAAERQLAASGQNGSGGAAIALEQYGQNMASTEYQNQYARLAQLSGANYGPGNAGGIAQQNAANQQNSANAVTNSLINTGTALYDNWNKNVSGNTVSPDPQNYPGGNNFGMDLGFES